MDLHSKLCAKFKDSCPSIDVVAAVDGLQENWLLSFVGRQPLIFSDTTTIAGELPT